MDQSFSRYAIASIALALLVPVEVYATVHGMFASLGIIFVLVIVGTPLGAVVLGHKARGQVRRSGYVRGGYGTGSAGMILGYLTFAHFSYLCLMFWTSPILNGVDTDESMVLASFIRVSQGLDEYAKLHPDEGYPSSLDELASDAELVGKANAQRFKIEAESAREDKIGYRFSYVSSPPRHGLRRDSFELSADPTRHLWHTRRHFFVNQTGVLHQAVDHPASVRDEESYPLF